MNEEEIKDILRHREKKLDTIHKKIMSLYEELNREAALAEAALPAINTSALPGAKGQHKDLCDILLHWQKLHRQREIEIMEMMWKLTDEESRINRVWACFHALDEIYYSMFWHLYVENQLYETTAIEFCGSRKTFEKYRKKGMQQLIDFYESGESTAVLMCRSREECQIGKQTNKGRVVREWQEKHPDGKKADCIRETGFNKDTVSRWWKADTGESRNQLQGGDRHEKHES